jgi:hypothetical protein
MADPPTSTDLVSSPQAPQPCRLLALPTELRDYIWELAFLPYEPPGREAVQQTAASTAHREDLLLAPHHPSTALLLACHQTHSETISFFHTAVESYLSQTSFVMAAMDTTTPTWNAIQSKHLRSINHLKLTGLDDDPPDAQFRFGYWYFENADLVWVSGAGPSTIWIKTPSTRENLAAVPNWLKPLKEIIDPTLDYVVFPAKKGCMFLVLVSDKVQSDDEILLKIKEIFGYQGLTKDEMKALVDILAPTETVWANESWEDWNVARLEEELIRRR